MKNENEKIAKTKETAEELYKALYLNSREATMTLEPPEWRFTSGNPAAIKMFNVKDEKEFVSLGPWDLSPEKQPDGSLSSEKAKEMIEEAIRSDFNYFSWTHKRYKGEDFPATVLLSKVGIDGKKFLLAIVRDVSEEKKIEKERNEKIAELESLNAAMVGRELKMLELKKENEKLREQLKK